MHLMVAHIMLKINERESFRGDSYSTLKTETGSPRDHESLICVNLARKARKLFTELELYLDLERIMLIMNVSMPPQVPTRVLCVQCEALST